MTSSDARKRIAERKQVRGFVWRPHDSWHAWIFNDSIALRHHLGIFPTWREAMDACCNALREGEK